MPPSLRECCLALWREGNNLIQARWDGILPQGSPSDAWRELTPLVTTYQQQQQEKRRSSNQEGRQQRQAPSTSNQEDCYLVAKIIALRKDMAICVSSIDIIKDMMLDR
uniref:Uncharacterized protein n=1 Tax=Oryza barthii TaxID=65489 RepID=A0A0D3HD08_9ORYZ